MGLFVKNDYQISNMCDKIDRYKDKTTTYLVACHVAKCMRGSILDRVCAARGSSSGFEN